MLSGLMRTGRTFVVIWGQRWEKSMHILLVKLLRGSSSWLPDNMPPKMEWITATGLLFSTTSMALPAETGTKSHASYEPAKPLGWSRFIAGRFGDNAEDSPPFTALAGLPAIRITKKRNHLFY